MELVVFAKELLQNAAEHMAGYRLGQAVLRHLDRTLWVVEKCARWAVPPPLDQDERPQPELLRPLPWIFFLTLLVVLRVTRESISLINLVMGKPPLRSADVVMYIQSKRRYLRTLKYTGSRAMRNRVSQPRPWYTQLQSMLELTMCFRRQSHYGNNNTTSHSNNDEVLVVKRSKRGRETTSPTVSGNETTMERLIEKMMVDLDVESDDDSSYTLTNATSIKSDNSDTSVESDQEVVYKNDSTLTKPNEDDAPMEETVTGVDRAQSDENNFSPNKIDIASSTPEKEKNVDTAEEVKLEEYPAPEDKIPAEEKALPPPDKQEIASPKAESKSFIDNENSMQNQTSPKNEQKIANGRVISTYKKKRGVKNERRDTDASVTKKPADRTF
ncbi:uncharacterized protein LOC131848957 isoform X2 [Achroia grisella]|uniref:uncharacterized protein LOC131848957 isoform X2 n=1 Tax=Achroia grisella TaxID=688607 RepID=UPI0027D2CCFA|nr:uncharacterized protein LOC131848957 isoform X2 [Achroia grisella]